MGDRKIVIPLILSSILILLVLAVMTTPAAASPNEHAQNPDDKSNGKPQIVSAMGTVPGKDLNVHIWVLVPHGVDKDEVVKQALAKHGARPFVGDKFTTISLYWDQFGDGNLNNDFVTQNYNPLNDPSSGGGLTAILNTQSTWSNVDSSSFTFLYGGQTNRCPSLVQECPGSQFFDGYNDFAWLLLAQNNVLGVAWSGTSIDEVDIALNTNFSWATNGNDYDIETVLLHENGHASGLGHSNDPQAVMYPSYHGILRVLQSDDIAGISSLYPSSEPPVPSEPSISITNPIDGSIVNGKITITTSVTGVNNPTVSFSLLDPDTMELVMDLGSDSTYPYEVSLHTKNISEGYYIIKAEIGSQSLEHSITIQKEGKGGGGSDDGGGTGGSCPPAKKAKGKC